MKSTRKGKGTVAILAVAGVAAWLLSRKTALASPPAASCDQWGKYWLTIAMSGKDPAVDIFVAQHHLKECREGRETPPPLIQLLNDLKARGLSTAALG